MTENLGLKILALVLAIVLWAFVRVTQGRMSTQVLTQMTMQLPLQLQGAPASMVAYGDSVDNVSVTLQGKADVIRSLREGLVRAYVDLSGMAPGSHWPEVKVIAPGGVQVVSVQPTSINVKLSPLDTREVPVKIVVSGNAASGMKPGTPQTSPDKVKVQGPRALVSQVKAVQGQVVLDGQSRAYGLNVAGLRPVAIDGSAVGAGSSRLRLVPKQVAVTIPIETNGRTVGAPVSLQNMKVAPRSGWSYIATVAPQFVTLRLSKGVKPPDFVVTRPVSFGSPTSPATREVALELPRGMAIVGRNTVTISVTPRRSKTSKAPAASRGARKSPPRGSK